MSALAVDRHLHDLESSSAPSDPLLGSTAAKIAKLREWKTSGIITADEFTAQVSVLVNADGGAASHREVDAVAIPVAAVSNGDEAYARRVLAPGCASAVRASLRAGRSRARETAAKNVQPTYSAHSVEMAVRTVTPRDWRQWQDVSQQYGAIDADDGVPDRVPECSPECHACFAFLFCRRFHDYPRR